MMLQNLIYGIFDAFITMALLSIFVGVLCLILHFRNVGREKHEIQVRLGTFCPPRSPEWEAYRQQLLREEGVA